MPMPSYEKEFEATVEINATTSYNRLSPQIFVDEVTSFLDTDGILWRHFSRQELRRALEFHFERSPQELPTGNDRVNEILTMLEGRVILEVGGGARNIAIDNARNNRTNDKSNEATLKEGPYPFILSLCPTPNLVAIQSLHRKHQPNSSVSQAVATYAWVNSHLTDAFFDYDPNNLHSGRRDKGSNPMTTIIHLHQDVWNRSPDIVRSRLRSKCGIHRRIYARKTIVKRIPKSRFVPFLEENHLWGATGAKYGYGLFLKPSKEHPKQRNNGENIDGDEVLVAVVTFSSKRKINRASHKFHSFELLRFCTKLDTTVVGGLGKLVSAFVKDFTYKKKLDGKHVNPDGSSEDDRVEVDIITSIDRDFGSNTWPDEWQQMERMDPLPMFVGDVDGLRRHAVGAGLTPLEQTPVMPMTTSEALRAGLPDLLLWQLQQKPSHDAEGDLDWPWQMAALHGFHPVFDAGVERLMLVVDNEETRHTSTQELWNDSMPCYVKEHYSSKKGIDNMLRCIRYARSIN